MERRRFMKNVGISSAALVALPFGASAAAGPTPQAGNVEIMTEDELDLIENALSEIPADMQNADPAETPNFEAELEQQIGATAAIQGTGTGIAPASGWACAAAVATFVATNGIPVAKILRWIKDARKIWGGVRGIWTAIKSGQAAAEIGEEAAGFLGELLSVPGIVETCF